MVTHDHQGSNPIESRNDTDDNKRKFPLDKSSSYFEYVDDNK